jgi:hypothetical protein
MKPSATGETNGNKMPMKPGTNSHPEGRPLGKLIVFLSIALLCCIGHSAETSAPLTLYIVSEQRIEGGRFFDMFPFPRLGYIAPKPDLTVTHLKVVNLEEKPDSTGTVEDKNGKPRTITGHYVPRLFVTLPAEDVNRLRMLTERAAGQRLLVMLGEKPLALKRVADLIENPAFPVATNSANEPELRKTEDDLKKLLR